MSDGFYFPIIMTGTFLIGYPIYIWGPFVILLLRGWRTPADRHQYWLGLHASPWSVVFRNRKAVQWYFATATLMGHSKPAAHVYEWFGHEVTDAFRAVANLLWRHPNIHVQTSEVVTVLADEQVRDWASVLRHLPYTSDAEKAVLYARIEAIAVAENIPFEYAKAMYA